MYFLPFIILQILRRNPFTTATNQPVMMPMIRNIAFILILVLFIGYAWGKQKYDSVGILDLRRFIRSVATCEGEVHTDRLRQPIISLGTVWWVLFPDSYAISYSLPRSGSSNSSKVTVIFFCKR